MAERATIFQAAQIGVEATPGTQVAANRKLIGLSIEPSPNVEEDPFKPQGSKVPTLVQKGKDWTTADLDGRALYTELPYIFSSLLLAATPTSLGGAPIAYQWSFIPTQASADTPKTFTVEHGDGRAGAFTYGLVTEFGMTLNRDEISIEGSMIGRDYIDGVTLTAAPTSSEEQVIHPSQVSVYSDTTSAGLGTTKLTRVLEFDWSISDRWGPVWVLDAAQSSWVAQVETEPKIETTLTVEADANGMAWLARARDNATRFVRLEATGANISGANNHRLRLDQAVKVTDTGEFSDEDGVFAIEFTLGAMYDSGWARYLVADVVTSLAAL
jgi:hypothetical protein